MTNPNDPTPDIDRCPVCQHWPAPHRGTCGGTAGRDRNGVDIVCGCDGAEYGLPARLAFLEKDVSDLAHSGAQAARGGLGTLDALSTLGDAVRATNDRVDGLRDAIGHLSEMLSTLAQRVNALEATVRELDDSLTLAHIDIDKLWERPGASPKE